MKRCPKCDTYKSLDQFGKDKSKKDGLKVWCKSCKKEYDSKYVQENKDWIYPKQIASKKVKRNVDSIYRMKDNYRRIVRMAFSKKNITKDTKSQEILGCDWETLSEYIESKFDTNMSWDNYGTYWEIDHLVPLSTAKTADDVMRLNHFTNLQPLEKNYNRNIKGSKISEEFGNKF